ncbi:MAG: hypothetical protein ACK50N_06115, partial [Flavobacteriales bacterium]
MKRLGQSLDYYYIWKKNREKYKRIDMKNVRLFFTLLLIVFFTISNVQGQEINIKKKKSKKGAKEVAEPKKEDKYGDLIKKCVKYDGLFTLY